MKKICGMCLMAKPIEAFPLLLNKKRYAYCISCRTKNNRRREKERAALLRAEHEELIARRAAKVNEGT